MLADDGKQAAGIVAFDTHSGKIQAIHARNVLLATVARADCSTPRQIPGI